MAWIWRTDVPLVLPGVNTPVGGSIIIEEFLHTERKTTGKMEEKICRNSRKCTMSRRA